MSAPIDRQQIEGVQEHAIVVSAGLQAREIADAASIRNRVIGMRRAECTIHG
jgi:hypothetical protein